MLEERHPLEMKWHVFFRGVVLEERRPLEMKGHVLLRGVVFAVVTVVVVMSAVEF